MFVIVIPSGIPPAHAKEEGVSQWEGVEGLGVVSGGYEGMVVRTQEVSEVVGGDHRGLRRPPQRL